MTLGRLLRIRRMVARRRLDLTVVLEDIYDPYNAQAVLRSCDAFGLQDVHIVQARQGRQVHTRIRHATSGSARKWLSVHYHDSIQLCLDALSEQGYQTVATVAPCQDAEALFSTDLSRDRLALVLGNEQSGLSDLALDLCDRRVSIPMTGMVQSLNLSVTASIFLFDAARQRAAAGVSEPLSPDRQRTLFAEYVRREREERGSRSSSH